MSRSWCSDTPVDSDEDYPDSIHPPPGRYPSNPPASSQRDVHWVIFSGDPDENVAEFIRRVQQASFLQDDSSNKDQKIAEYAMGCLTDEALIWACQLDEDIQQSWTRLRRELVSRFAPDRNRGASTARSSRSSRPSRSTTSESIVNREGMIELVDYEDGRVAGKLSIGPGDTAICTTVPKDEMRVEIPVSPTDTFEMKELWHLSHPVTPGYSSPNDQSDDPSFDDTDDEHPTPPPLAPTIQPTSNYDLRNRGNNNSNQVARRTPFASPGNNRIPMFNGRTSSSFHIWPPPPRHPFFGVALATGNSPGSVGVPPTPRWGYGPPSAQPNSPTMKWVFQHCGSSRIGDQIYKRRSDVLHWPEAAGSARVWKVSAVTDGIEELKIFWMENDLSLSELGVYREGYDNIVLYRLKDDILKSQGSGTTPAASPRRLRMIFRPADSPGLSSLQSGRSFSSSPSVSQYSAGNSESYGGRRRTVGSSMPGVMVMFASMLYGGRQGPR
ncbi:hypothetical protein FRB99_004220 [Tulasnella sp. 403]|nr:hypothetical protein FRB99_004220 [Tulasnella sp. 403]